MTSEVGSMSESTTVDAGSQKAWGYGAPWWAYGVVTSVAVLAIAFFAAILEEPRAEAHRLTARIAEEL